MAANGRKMNAHGRKMKHRAQDRTKIAGLNIHGKGALRGIGEFTTREHLQKLTVVAADRQKWRVLAARRSCRRRTPKMAS